MGSQTEKKSEGLQAKDADLRRWLLNFEKHLGRSCVVSLLIRDGVVSFLSASDAMKYLDQGEPDDPEPRRKTKQDNTTGLELHHNPISF